MIWRPRHTGVIRRACLPGVIRRAGRMGGALGTVRACDFGDTLPEVRPVETLVFAPVPSDELVEISDFLVDTETTAAKTGGTQSSMYAIHFSAADGVVGLQNGPLDVIDIGQLESKDAQRVRIRWYVSIALLRVSAVGRVKRLN